MRCDIHNDIIEMIINKSIIYNIKYEMNSFQNQLSKTNQFCHMKQYKNKKTNRDNILYELSMKRRCKK